MYLSLGTLVAADPGGICISESVHTAVGHKLPFDYEFMGEQQVKNIAKPVKAYRARLRSDAELPAPSKAQRPGKRGEQPPLWPGNTTIPQPDT